MSDEKKKDDKPEDTKANQKSESVSRRKFLKNAGIATGGVVGGALLGGIFTQSLTSNETKPASTEEPEELIDYRETRQFFKRKVDFDVLSIATERIFPEDDNGPGAIGLGVPYYIDKQLASPWGENAKDYMMKPFQLPDQTPLTRREIFIQGIRKINEVSQSEYGESFVNLEEDEQIGVLEMFDNNEIDMQYISSSQFFALLRQSTLEGCYSDPMYGGNKNMDGWRMKEYPGARLSYADFVEEEDFVSLEPVSLKTQ